MRKKQIVTVFIACLLILCFVLMPFFLRYENGAGIRVLADTTVAPTVSPSGQTSSPEPSSSPKVSTSPSASASPNVSASPSASGTPTPRPDLDTRTPVSISAICMKQALPVNTILLRDDFQVTAAYEDGSTHDVYGFEFDQEKITTSGKQDIGISYTINGTKRSCTVEIVGEVTDASNGYKVVFNTNGGSSVPDMNDIVAYSTIILPMTSKDGYWFRGWYKESSLKTRFTQDERVKSNLTLYAKWQKKDNAKKNTIDTVVTGEALNVQVQIDLTDQDIGPDVRPDVKMLDKKEVEKAVYAIAETEHYYALDFSIPDLYYNSAIPVPVVLNVPDDIDMNHYGIYMTTNKVSVMAQMPVTVTSGQAFTISRVPVVDGRVVTFNMYQDGVYLICQNIDDEGMTSETTATNPGLHIKPEKERLCIGQSVQLQHELVNVANANKIESEIQWKSLNGKRAMVDSRGMVTGLSVGEATVVCYVQDTSLSDSITFRITTDGTLITKIKPIDKKLKLQVGETERVIVKTVPTNATNKKYTYKSTRPKIATVSKRGIVKAKQPGNCTIKVKSTDGSFVTGRVKVNVKKAPKK